MLPGDFLEDETGKRLGTDGKNDGKYYVVTNKNEASQIERTNKAGGTTQLSQVSSAIDVTSGGYNARQAIGAAVNRSNQPGGTDTVGGFHEEAVTIGPDANGVERAIPSKPGPVSDPLVNSHAQVTPSDFANSADNGVLQNVDLIAHIHPKGTREVRSRPNNSVGQTTIGGSETVTRGEFVQRPSQTDINNALPGATNIVVGARDKTVYFYRNSGNSSNCNCVARLPLNVFLALR
jgi:hypothetical protein